ncbi:MAG: AarF/ABC1/UbiB kinase family protein [Actinobacteria bacterium]|nr:AarF/ABC1/UbiB kinase family protein [Actinomycetota bacterium]
MATDEPAADTARFTFTENGPWVVDRDQLPWTSGLPLLRHSVRRQVPMLTSRRMLPPLPRLAAVSANLAAALVPWAVLERRAGGGDSIAGLSRRLRGAAERLGPTYIKLGQIISSGEGLFPGELVEEFKLCRDQVRPEPWEHVRRVVEEDLGRPIEAVFASFDESPIAAASIAQVHAATLRSGEEVVVKVQRATIRQRVEQDLRVMSWIAPLLVGRIPVAALANPPALVELFAETITEELDFRLEAENMLDVAEVFAKLGQRGFVIARPHPELVTRRVLVMERLSGLGFDDIDAMRAAGVDTEAVVRTGMAGFTEGCIVHGIFHGDLHGGNLFVLDDGRIALLDFGITARMTELERSAFLRLMLCGAMGDIPGQIAAFRDLGALPPDTDIDDVIATLGLDKAPVDPTLLDQEQLVGEIQRIIKELLAMGARLPKILMLYVKNLVFLDGAIARLAPDLDLLGEVSNLSMRLVTLHGTQFATDLGVEVEGFTVDTTAIKASFGVVDDDAETLTYRELQARRDMIRRRLESRR